MHFVTAFSDDSVEPHDHSAAMARYSPPDNEAPAAVAASGVIGRSADAAAMLVGLTRYTRGLQLQLAIRRRLDPEVPDALHETMDAGLLVGVELADGRTAVAGLDPWDDPPAPDEPMLAHSGAGGGGREWAITLWLTPAPPPGDLVIVVANPTLGIAESSLTVGADALRHAADAVEVLWPREPDRAHPGLQRSRPDAPPGGWFERAIGRQAGDTSD